MSIVFGVSNSSPERVMTKLVQCSLVNSFNDIGLIGSGSRLDATKKPAVPYILCLTLADFNRNLNVFNSRSYDNVVVLVFASALRLHELRGSTPLDFAVDAENISGCAFKMSDTISLSVLRKTLRRGSTQVVRTNANYLHNMMDSVREGSLLNPLFTFLYTLNSGSQHHPVKDLCVRWLYSGKKVELLKEKLVALEHPLSANKSSTLLSILTSKEALAVRKLFRDMRQARRAGDAVNVKSLCKQHGVHEYEISYLLSVKSAKVI